MQHSYYPLPVHFPAAWKKTQVQGTGQLGSACPATNKARPIMVSVMEPRPPQLGGRSHQAFDHPWLGHVNVWTIMTWGPVYRL